MPIRQLLLCLILLHASLLHANALKQSPSPYLAMHGNDPVNWHDLNPEALDKARKQQKMIFISSGYFACHWCHVMQKESYQNSEIADFMNEHFVSIKMDRELNPVIDAQLIVFVDRTRGQAGWPLNVFLTPEGYPLFGIIYLPPAEFLGVMEQLVSIWTEDPDELRAIAQAAADELRFDEDQANQRLKPVDATALKEAHLTLVSQYANEMEGGFGNGAKFPHVPQLTALLLMGQQTPFLRTTLQAMATEHLYDHLNGGFFRYTTDPDWQTPHFEKMLYDNALLSNLYLQAGEQFNEQRYTQTAIETLHFMIGSMRHEEGGYIASLSAVDENNIEGGFYLWERDAVEKTLDKKHYALIHKHWGMDQASRFEDGYLPTSIQDITGNERIVLDEAYRSLRLRREKELHLPVDDKRLSGWNGLTLTALARCAQAGDALCKQAASAQAAFIESMIMEDGLTHGMDRYGESLGPGTLEDYAYVIQGLYTWGSNTRNDALLKLSDDLHQDAQKRFRRPNGWMASQRPLLPGTRPQQQMPDTVLPSPTAILLAYEQATARNKDIKKDVTVAVRDNPFNHASLIVLVINLKD